MGAGPFVDGLRLTTAWALAAAVAITSLTTLCCAWRWSLVAGGLGVDVPLRTAVSAYYRSQFLNSTLPGGVLGDVHRGVLHGRAVGDLGRGLRSVAWDRAAGQAVQALLTVAVVLLLAPPAGSLCLVVAWVVAAVAGVALVVVLLCLNPGRLATRITRAVTSDLRGSVLSRRAWPGIVVASTVAVMGHVAVFVVAVQVTGTELPVGRLLPLALVVLLASAVPANIAGWGPREGAAAWAFGAVGLSAAEGVTVAVVYGVLALVATLPGAVIMVAGRAVGTARASWPGRRRSESGALYMPERPYTLLSCGMSIDGYIDTATDERLVLSNDADLDRVDAVRADSDAILVGAATVRNDNPRLLVRAPSRRAQRIARGLSPTPIKVTVTSRAELDPCAAFFVTGDTEKLVYCPTDAVAEARCRLGAVATVVDGGRPMEMCRISEDLRARGVRRLMIEGGGKVLTQFLTAGLADELHLVVAPFFVGDSRAQRFVGDGSFPWNPDRRAELAEVRRHGNVVLLRYALSDRFEKD